MLLCFAIAAGVVIGLARGGRLTRLATLRLRCSWLVVPPLVMQLSLILAPPVPPAQGTEPLRFWLPVTLIPLAVFVWMNRRLPGMRLVLLGLTANGLVIVANGGLMPTSERALLQARMGGSLELGQNHAGVRLPRSKNVLLPPEQTRLRWLSDTLVSPPVPRRKVFSAGDVLVGGGLALLGARTLGSRRSAAPSNASVAPPFPLRARRGRSGQG
jgi:hypothetical protein